MHTDEVVGTISIDRQTGPEENLQSDLAFLNIVANVLAEAVFNIRIQLEERENLLAENRKLRSELAEQYRPGTIIGNCQTMRHVYGQIAQVAKSPASVLIRGESGTGKELVARAIHFGSNRKDGPFISVNCAALPENLIESELFGHEKGAFTSAVQQRKGRFELASGGRTSAAGRTRCWPSPRATARAAASPPRPPPREVPKAPALLLPPPRFLAPPIVLDGPARERWAALRPSEQVAAELAAHRRRLRG